MEEKDDGKPTGRDEKGKFVKGNREGRLFSSDVQPKNYRKPSILKHVESNLIEDGYVMFNKIEVIRDGKPTGEFIAGRIKMPNEAAIAAHYIGRSKKSDRILLDLVDRIDGKVQNKVDVTSF